jgi:hypothetical protein
VPHGSNHFLDLLDALLEDLGYTESDILHVTVPVSGNIERTLYVKNTAARTMPTLDLDVTMLSNGNLYLGGDVIVQTIEAETKYTVQYKGDLGAGSWANLDSYTASSKKDTQAIYPNYWDREFSSKRFYRVLVETPIE